jgi:hypothetical protein
MVKIQKTHLNCHIQKSIHALEEYQKICGSLVAKLQKMKEVE